MAYFMLVLMIVSAVFQSSAASRCESSFSGREFYFGVLPYASDCCHDSYHIVALDVTNASPNDTRIRLQIPYFNNDTYYNIPSGATKKISISNSIEKDMTFIDSRGIRISSKNDISVLVSVVFNSPNTIDSYNVFPVSTLGRKYIISSYGSNGGSHRGGIVLVSGVFNNTEVTVVNGTDVLRHEIINSFDVFQFLCGECDLTGVKVLADKNVYVVSGSTYTGIPLWLSAMEYIASEMLPSSSLSKNYIVAPVLPKPSFMIRVLANMSTFNVRVASLTSAFNINPSPKDLYFATEAVVLTANSSFSVTQYGVNYKYDYVAGDPFMVAVPGVDQYINDYKFTVPRGYYGGVKHYVAVIIPLVFKNGLSIDGTLLGIYNGTVANVTSLQVPMPFNNYTILTFSVNEGYHHISHKYQSVTFGVFVYGHGLSGNSALSYAFYAGYNIKGSCLAKAQMCYNCEDLSHVDLCDTVKQCDIHEVCFLERYKDSGQIKYRSGCLDKDTCAMKRNDSDYADALCFECCYGEYCNNKGCGENGIPERDTRGPICYDCQHVSSPEECIKVTPCDSHQVCRIEEYQWFDHSHFKLGCGHGLCDPINRMGSHVFKRATPVCHSCCTDDYCNRNCTTDPKGQDGLAIVG